MNVALAAREKSYKTTGKSIRRLVVLVKVFYIGLLSSNSPCHPIVRYFATVISGDYIKS